MATIQRILSQAACLRGFLAMIATVLFCIYAPNATAATGDGAEEFPRLGSNGAGSFYAIWESGNDLFGSLSTNNGRTWAPPLKLSEARPHWTSPLQKHPQAVVYANGHWVVYYRDFKATIDIFEMYDCVIRSSDGVNWSEPVELFGRAQMMGPVMATFTPPQLSTAHMASDNQNTIIATAGVASNGASHKVARSTDGGETWTYVEIPLPYGVFGQDRYRVIHAGNETWHIAYSGNRAGFGAPPDTFSNLYTSTDNGQTWTTSDTTADIIQFGGVAAHDNYLAVFNYPGFSYTEDAGLTWTSPVTNESTNTLNSLTVDSDGNWVAATHDAFNTTNNLAGTWTAHAPPAVPGPGGANWPVFATNGTRIGLLRSYSPGRDAWPLQAYIIFQYSDNGGQTWSKPNMISEAQTAATDWQLFE